MFNEVNNQENIYIYISVITSNECITEQLLQTDTEWKQKDEKLASENQRNAIFYEYSIPYTFSATYPNLDICMQRIQLALSELRTSENPFSARQYGSFLIFSHLIYTH